MGPGFPVFLHARAVEEAAASGVAVFAVLMGASYWLTSRRLRS